MWTDKRFALTIEGWDELSTDLSPSAMKRQHFWTLTGMDFVGSPVPLWSLLFYIRILLTQSGRVKEAQLTSHQQLFFGSHALIDIANLRAQIQHPYQLQYILLVPIHHVICAHSDYSYASSLDQFAASEQKSDISQLTNRQIKAKSVLLAEIKSHMQMHECPASQWTTSLIGRAGDRGSSMPLRICQELFLLAISNLISPTAGACRLRI